jgi:hypothetical protein
MLGPEGSKGGNHGMSADPTMVFLKAKDPNSDYNKALFLISTAKIIQSFKKEANHF